MKYIKSKCLQKAKGKKKGKYLLTLEVSDYDLDMLENLAVTYAPWDYSMFEGKLGVDKKTKVGIEVLDMKPKYTKWIDKMWRAFWKLWHEHDEL